MRPRVTMGRVLLRSTGYAVTFGLTFPMLLAILVPPRHLTATLGAACLIVFALMILFAIRIRLAHRKLDPAARVRLVRRLKRRSPLLLFAAMWAPRLSTASQRRRHRRASHQWIQAGL